MKVKYPYASAFATRLQCYLNEHRLSIAGLSKKSGIAPSTLRKWLAQTNTPDRPRLLAFCRLLDLDAREFLADVGATGEPLRDPTLVGLVQRRYVAAVEDGDANQIADALVMAGAAVFSALRRRGIPGVLVADPLGSVSVRLTQPKMLPLRVMVTARVVDKKLSLRVEYDSGVVLENCDAEFSEQGFTALSLSLRKYADKATRSS